ncbi:MAG: LysR family transcriptional regulator [Arenicella sp.]
MKNYRRSLPPLDYLLFFEAVARHGSFTRAAEELNISQAAVSKRVKGLEDLLGFSLVDRHGRNISFTQEGHKLASKTSEVLDYLEKCLIQMKPASNHGLKLASNVATSQFWLTPRINEYLLKNNPAPVTLTASDKDSDVLASDSDAVIYYGSDIPSGWDGTVLFEEIWLPLAAPELYNPELGISAYTLLDFEKLAPKWINWPDLANRIGLPDFSDAKKVNLGSYSNTVYAAIRGRGIALGSPDVLQNEIDSGRLIPLYNFQLKTERCYFVIWKKGTLTPHLRDLLHEVAGISF